VRAILYKENESRKRTFHIRLEASVRNFAKRNPYHAFFCFKSEVEGLEKLGYKIMWLTNQRYDDNKVAFLHGKRVKKKTYINKKEAEAIAKGLAEMITKQP